MHQVTRLHRILRSIEPPAKLRDATRLGRIARIRQRQQRQRRRAPEETCISSLQRQYQHNRQPQSGPQLAVRTLPPQPLQRLMKQ